MRIPKSKVLYVSVAAVAVAVLGGTAATANAAYKTVTVQDNGQRKVIRGFSFGNVKKYLADEHVLVSAHDKVSPGLNTDVANGMTIVITRPVDVTLVDGQSTTKVETFSTTVGQLLDEHGVTLGDGDTVNVGRDTKLTSGITVQIRRTDKKVDVKTQDIPFQTIRQRTDKLYTGQQRVLTHGVKGSMQIQTTSVYVNGHKVGQSVAQKVLHQPVNQVVEIGTQQRPQRLSARSGESFSVVKQLTVLATAYAAGGRTATGYPAQPGVIAVDPKVIPLGTKLYIPGIGVVRAADTGSAIRGNRIDVCLSSYAAACAWGLRTLTIYEIQ